MVDRDSITESSYPIQVSQSQKHKALKPLCALWT